MSDKYPGGFVTAGAPAGFSVAFDGTGDYLSTPSATALQLTSATAFTIEAWAYPTSFPNGQFISAGSGGQANAYYWQYYSSQLQLGVQGGSSITVASWTPVANTWYHVAVTRSGTNVYQFVNGVQLGTTATSSQSFADGPTYIAYGGAGYFNGYISNARIIKGTALYTTTFTPPTQLFPITNTTLLTCQSPTFIDNSTTAATITQNGSPKVSNFTPFAGYTGFNPALGAAAGGVWTIDESAYYQQNRLWPLYDPYFNQTTLMLHGNGTNGAQNNTFLDSSVNNFTITRNGNTTQGTFTPFSQTGWSNFFNSSANYLTVPANSNFVWSTGARTYEAWVYVTSVAANNAIFGLTNLSSSNTWELYINTSSQVVFRYFAGSAQTVTTTGTVPLNTWAHVAFVYDGTSAIAIYINGVASGTGTKTGTPVSDNNQLCIGRTNVGGAGDVFFSGYISNVRFTTTTVYTSNFTPSNAPLTAVTGTTLLTCQDNRFVDDSANNATVTANGSVSVQAFSPFVPAYITPTTFSNYFDGTGDYLQIASATALQLNTSVAWTIEAWVYPTTLSGDNGIIAKRSGGTTEWQFSHSSGTGLTLYTGSTTYFSGQTLTVNKFQHVAITWDLTTLRFFIDGVQTPTTNTGISLPASSTNPVNIASNTAGGETWYGCISNLRLVKGTALYTASFTPPTAPLTAVTNTQLLTCQSSTFIDNSTNNFTITANGNAQPVTSPTPFPAKVDTTTLNSAYSTSLIGGSAYFDGTGDYLTASGANLALGAGSFTVEGWVYITGYNGGAAAYSGIGSYPDSTALMFYINASGGYVVNVGASDIITTGTAPLNTWIHFAVVRSSTGSNGLTLYINGISVATATSATNFTSTNAVIGRTGISTSSNLMLGYLSGTRVVVGTALYTQNFAPPIAPATPSNLTNNGTQSGTLTFVVGSDAPNTLYYVCQNHSAMAGVINIVNSGTYEKVYAVTANGSSNYVINGSSNPTLTLVRGETYTFNVNATGHPFWITKASGAYSAGNVYLGTTLLTNFTNGAIFDNTAKNVLETVSGASLSTAQAKYGTTSMAFNGSSDYVVTPSNALISAWGGDFTIEGWYYSNSIASTPPLWTNSTANSDGMNSLYVYANGSLGFGKVGVNEIVSATGLWQNSRWNHTAVVRSGANVFVYLNGVQVASGAASTYVEASTVKPITLGRQYQSSPVYYNGYIQDFRVTKGYARYLTNFTPPTSQLQDQ